MARIKSIIPPCGYVVEGVASIQLLDWDDFRGFAFFNNELYSNCLVTAIARVAAFTDMPAVNAKYSSTQNGKLEIHTIETFLGQLDAESLSNLILAKKRRYVPVFKLNNGKYYTFGYEAGAAVSYVNQSTDGIGTIITISAPSIYPLFEVTENAAPPVVNWIPDYSNGYCIAI